MAKQKLNVKQYFEQLTAETGLDSHVAAAVVAAMDNEKFRSKVEEFGLMRSDYSADKDALRKEREAIEADKKRWTDWYETEAKPYVIKAKTRLEQYEKTFGPIEDITSTGDPNVVRTATGEYISKAQADQLLRDNNMGLAEAFSTFVKGLTRVTTSHLKRFDEELDVDDLDKYMTEHKISDVAAGYKEYIQPRLDELREKETERRIKEAAENAVKDFRSKNQFPDNPRPTTTKIPIFDAPVEKSQDSPAVSRMSRLAAFNKAWENSADAVGSD